MYTATGNGRRDSVSIVIRNAKGSWSEVHPTVFVSQQINSIATVVDGKRMLP